MIRNWWKRFRDAVTGRFITRDRAERNPSTTVGEKVKRRPVSRKGHHK